MEEKKYERPNTGLPEGDNRTGVPVLREDCDYSAREVAGMLNMPTHFVQRLMREGRLSYYAYGPRNKRVPGSAIKAFRESVFQPGEVA